MHSKLRTIAAVAALAASALFAPAAWSAPFTSGEACSVGDSGPFFCRIPIKRPQGAAEIKFVSCSVIASPDTEIFEVELETGGVELPLLWERARGKKTQMTFNQVLSVHVGANTGIQFFINATGAFSARCMASGE